MEISPQPQDRRQVRNLLYLFHLYGAAVTVKPKLNAIWPGSRPKFGPSGSTSERRHVSPVSSVSPNSHSPLRLMHAPKSTGLVTTVHVCSPVTESVPKSVTVTESLLGQ